MRMNWKQPWSRMAWKHWSSVILPIPVVKYLQGMSSWWSLIWRRNTIFMWSLMKFMSTFYISLTYILIWQLCRAWENARSCVIPCQRPIPLQAGVLAMWLLRRKSQTVWKRCMISWQWVRQLRWWRRLWSASTSEMTIISSYRRIIRIWRSCLWEDLRISDLSLQSPRAHTMYWWISVNLDMTVIWYSARNWQRRLALALCRAPAFSGRM